MLRCGDCPQKRLPDLRKASPYFGITPFWDYTYEGSAVKFFKDWCKQVNGSNLEPVKKVSSSLSDLETSLPE
jgi:hypothetical protein